MFREKCKASPRSLNRFISIAFEFSGSDLSHRANDHKPTDLHLNEIQSVLPKSPNKSMKGHRNKNNDP